MNNRINGNLECTGSNRELVEALTRNGVAFVIIGGLAVAWHCSTRLADDMDLLVNPTPDNSERICAALEALRLTGYNKHSFTKAGLQAQLKQRHYAELLTPREGGPTNSDIAADSVDAKLFNIPVRVASAASLIRLKELAVSVLEAERGKHLKDIELLRIIGDPS